jgi:hypothetical protein
MSHQLLAQSGYAGGHDGSSPRYAGDKRFKDFWFRISLPTQEYPQSEGP